MNKRRAIGIQTNESTGLTTGTTTHLLSIWEEVV
jgi:hypothetical protein